jgi:hypothetical protein
MRDKRVSIEPQKRDLASRELLVVGIFCYGETLTRSVSMPFRESEQEKGKMPKSEPGSSCSSGGCAYPEALALESNFPYILS